MIVRILQRVIGKILNRAIEPDLPACFHAWTSRGRIDDAVIEFNTWTQTLAHARRVRLGFLFRRVARHTSMVSALHLLMSLGLSH